MAEYFCKIQMPLFDFRNFIASRRVLATGRIVSGFSFCNSLFVVSLSDLSKIAIKFAVFDNLPSPSSVGRNFSSLNGSMPGKAKDNHWKIPPSKSSAAAATPASSRTRPKQSIPEGKPLCNPTSGGDAGGGPSTHQQNQSETGRGNSFPVERRSVLPPYRPHDQQRQPLFDFPPTISPSFAVPGGPGGRRLHPRSEGASGLGSGSSNGGRSGVGILLEDLRPWMFGTNRRNDPAP